MFIEYSDIKLNLEEHINIPGGTKCLFLIHGFTGSARDWKSIAPDLDNNYNIYMVDLIGHGISDSPSDPLLYTEYSITHQLKEILLDINNPFNVILGYSMGGRAALSFAVKNKDMIEGLILESTSPGLRNDMERAKRMLSDENLASYISSHAVEEFIDYWMNTDTFATQNRFSKDKLRKLKEDKLDNNKTGLINALRKFGTGAMNPLYEELKELKVPTLLLSGELDSKFSKLNYDMAAELPFGTHDIIKHAGHNTHLEEPAQFISAVNKFIKEL